MGAVISDAVLGQAVSAPDGKYSFYRIATTGTATLTVIYPNYSFSTSPATLNIPAGNQIVNFTGTRNPALSIGKSHSGNFTQGQNGATYTVTVSNAAGAGPANGKVTVTETVPSGMTLVSMSGTGWTCPGTAANNCTRSEPLNGGASYPAITVTVIVAGNAMSSLVNSVSVSGGGPEGASATDPTTVIAVPVLSIGGTHAGNFVQGQNGATYTVSVSNAPGAVPGSV